MHQVLDATNSFGISVSVALLTQFDVVDWLQHGAGDDLVLALLEQLVGHLSRLGRLAPEDRQVRGYCASGWGRRGCASGQEGFPLPSVQVCARGC